MLSTTGKLIFTSSYEEKIMHYLIIAVLAFALSMLGCEGKTGPAGPTGAAGTAGPQGVAGPAGPVGPAGPAGADGTPGEKGEKGDPGERGPEGPKGDQGDPGAGADPGAIQDIIDGVVDGGVLADIHHILIFQDGEEKASRRVNAPGFDQALETIVLLVDATTSLVAKAGAQNEEKINVTFSWNVKDVAFASVDEDGTVTGLSNGTTNVILSVDGRGIEVEIPITVYKGVDTVTLTPDGAGPLRVGDTRILTARALDESDADKGVIIPGIEFVWESSDEDVATVKADKDNSAMATVTAKGAGSATITGTAAGTTKDAEYEVMVFEVEGVERRLSADVPYEAVIDETGAVTGGGVTITATLEQKNTDGEWENAPDGVTVTFAVVSGPVHIADGQAMPTTSSGQVTLALTAKSDPTADPVVTGINGEGTAIIRISSAHASTIYVEVKITEE